MYVCVNLMNLCICLHVCVPAPGPLVYCKDIMEGLHVYACMGVNVHRYILCVILGGLLQRRINQ